MSIKISKISNYKALNCKIHPVLYNVFCSLKDLLGAELVHRRKRKSNMCIEIIFRNELFDVIQNHINSLPDAEKSGFWVICKPQTNNKHMFYKGHRVFLLYLSPVHPKKRRQIQTNITPLSSSIANEALFG